MAIVRAGLLVAAALLLAASAVDAKRPLNRNNYGAGGANEQICMDAIWAAANARLTNSAQIANCIRFAFHEAGTYLVSTDDGGADGSLRTASEQMSAANLGLAQGNINPNNCADVLTLVVADVRAVPGCSQATWADIIQITAAVGTFVLGGQPIPMILGRTDVAENDPITSFTIPDSRIPGPCTDLNGLIGFWTSKGMSNPALATVTLNAAHGLGRVRAQTDPTCIPGGGGVLGGASTPIRTAGPAFDGSYFDRLLAGLGHFLSDQTTVALGASTLAQVQAFAANKASFQAAWVSQYQEMSLLGVDFTGGVPRLPSSFPPVRVQVSVPNPSPPPPAQSPPPPPVVVASPPPPPVVVNSPPPPPVLVFSPPPPPAVVVDPSSPPPPDGTYNAPAPDSLFVQILKRLRPPPPPDAYNVYNSPPPPATTYEASSPPPPASTYLASPPPPGYGPVCGKLNRLPQYCALTEQCCSSKTCCAADRTCCGTACCQAGQVCCAVQTYNYITQQWATSDQCMTTCPTY